MVQACSGPMESRAWGLQPTLHSIRMTHKSWESPHSNSMHFCVTYPLFVCYRLTQWSVKPLLPRRGPHELLLASPCILVCHYLARLKWRSKGPLCLFFSAFKTWNKLNSPGRKGRNKQRAINQMHIADGMQIYCKHLHSIKMQNTNIYMRKKHNGVERTLWT